MGLKSDITEAATEALASDLLDARADLVFVSVLGSGYDPVAGSATATETRHQVTGVKETVGIRAIDGEIIRIGDVKFIIFSDDLNAIPVNGDYVEHVGKKYEINNVVIDPANVAWELYARNV